MQKNKPTAWSEQTHRHLRKILVREARGNRLGERGVVAAGSREIESEGLPLGEEVRRLSSLLFLLRGCFTPASEAVEDAEHRVVDVVGVGEESPESRLLLASDLRLEELVVLFAELRAEIRGVGLEPVGSHLAALADPG